MTSVVKNKMAKAAVPAFPVPQAGALADLEAVVAAQLVFARTAAHQFFRPVPLQKLYRRHLFCLPELFLFKVQFFTPNKKTACDYSQAVYFSSFSILISFFFPLKLFFPGLYSLHL